MAVRLIELHRVLKDTGSIYLHCDPTASHYLKLLMDTIWGHGSFINEIIWCYGLGGSSKRYFSKKHDVIFLYSKTNKYYFDKPLQDSTSNAMGGKKKGMLDVWMDIPSLNNMAKERTGYPTQKPLALLERIIEASSNSGDIVLDPFCGCATTCVAADKLHRKWIGIDVSDKAYELVVQRISELIPDDLGSIGQLSKREDIPTRTDLKQKSNPTKQDKQLLYGKQNGQCNGCYIRFEIQNLTVDHVIPHSRGGSHEIVNLQLLCNHCNSIKGNRPMEYLRAKIEKFVNSRTQQEIFEEKD